MAEKVQFMVTVDEPLRDRLDALRIVLGVSRAEVNRRALEHRASLAGMEKDNAARLGRLYTLASTQGKSWNEYVRSYTESYRQSGPTLETLEEKQAEAAR